MNKIFRRFIGLLGMSLALTTHAAFALMPGQKLSDADIAQMGKLPVYQIGRLQFRVIPSQQADNGATLVLNKQGVVGLSHNEVHISGATAQDIQAKLKELTPQPLSVQTFEPTGITVARYADFGQAVEGLNTLKVALPDAKVRLAVQFAKQAPY